MVFHRHFVDEYLFINPLRFMRIHPDNDAGPKNREIARNIPAVSAHSIFQPIGWYLHYR
jgi:hypothetical protein